MIEQWDKYCYTAILCLNHMAFAMSVTAIGPVLTELVDILQTSPQYMTIFTTFTSTGFLIGSFFCFLLKYLNRQLVWTAYLVLMAICVAVVPHSPNLITLYALAIGIGMGAGVLNTIINVWIIEMWKDKSPSILQIPGLTFGIGTILSPLIIKPFLRENYSAVIQQNSTSINTNNDIFNQMNETVPQSHSNVNPNAYNEVYEEWRRSLLTTPFIILGLVQVLFPFLMLVMFVVKRYEYSEDRHESKALNRPMSDVSKLFDRQRRQRTTVLILFAILLGIFNINECMYYTFAPTYFQYSPLQLSAPKAAEMITAFTIPYTVFRGLSCLIAIKVLPKYMLSAHYIASFVGILLLMFGRNSESLLLVANIVVGIGLSALMQTTFAFVGQHIHLNDKIGTILIVVMGSFNIAPPYVLGLFIKDYSVVFILFESITLIICITIFITLLLLIFKYEKVEKLKNESRLINKEIS